MYGDQEICVSAVDSLCESVRRALLQKPLLAPYFFELAMLNCLSYDVKRNKGGPDGSIIKAVINADDKSRGHIEGLKVCALILIEGKKNLRKLNAITIADAVVLGGAKAIAAVGGPVLPCQLGRTDASLKAPIPSSMPPLNLFTGDISPMIVADTFHPSGLMEHEMTALLGCLLSMDSIEKATLAGDWKQSNKPKFCEAGKIGQMLEFKKLSDDDIAAELAKGDDDESYVIEGDDD